MAQLHAFLFAVLTFIFHTKQSHKTSVTVCSVKTVFAQCHYFVSKGNK